MPNHLIVQINVGLAAFLHSGLIEVSEVIIYQGADHTVLQNIN